MQGSWSHEYLLQSHDSLHLFPGNQSALSLFLVCGVKNAERSATLIWAVSAYVWRRMRFPFRESRLTTRQKGGGEGRNYLFRMKFCGWKSNPWTENGCRTTLICESHSSWSCTTGGMGVLTKCTHATISAKGMQKATGSFLSRFTQPEAYFSCTESFGNSENSC